MRISFLTGFPTELNFKFPADRAMSSISVDIAKDAKQTAKSGVALLKLSTFTRMDDDRRHTMLRSGALFGLEGETA